MCVTLTVYFSSMHQALGGKRKNAITLNMGHSNSFAASAFAHILVLTWYDFSFFFTMIKVLFLLLYLYGKPQDLKFCSVSWAK